MDWFVVAIGLLGLILVLVLEPSSARLLTPFGR